MISTAEDLFEFSGLDQASDRQERLSALIITETHPDFNPMLVCGLDAAYVEDKAAAAAVVWDLSTQSIIEIAEFRAKVSVNYRSGYFGFREGRLLAGATARLKSNPDVFLVDAHGIAHPRRFGLACHVGLAIDKPTIGVAKSHLYGTVKDENVVDANNTIIGKILTGKKGRTSYVSVGHKIGLEKAVEIVESCSVANYPIPLHLAHAEAVRLREYL